MLVGLALATLIGVASSASFKSHVLVVSIAMLLGGLMCSFFHLGRPERAWRAATMWRTSWLSREVIVLPVFIGLVLLWWWFASSSPIALLLLVITIAAVLWVCTAKIYSCLTFIQEWAQPFTLVNYILIGLSSGFVLLCTLAALTRQGALVNFIGPWALSFTVAAGVTKVLALRHNANIKPRSTLQSATGIQAERLEQKSMGMSAGAFNTREFFHGQSVYLLKNLRWVHWVLAFGIPVLCMIWGLALSQLSSAQSAPSATPWVIALLLQWPGLIAERWLFFAQARHPQNLYYQVVS
jgi:sulfite dehydrogenase (quinone) subunit SoeC